MNPNKQTRKSPFRTIIFALSVIVSLSAFRHTDVEGYTDPDFQGYQFDTVVLQMPNATIKFKRYVVKYLEKQFKKRGIRMVMHDDLFAPTREWDEESSAAIYERQGIDAGLIITIGDTGSKSTPGMTMFNATSYGGMTTGQVNTIRFATDHASFDIALVDAESKRTVWVGELDTRGAGLLFVGNKKTAKALVKGLVRDWRDHGHLSR